MEQKHIIKRQIIEVTVPNAAAAPAIQDEISRVYRQRILPLIDLFCSELGAPDRLYRIDLLELDVGVLDAQDLEAQFVARINATLPRQLAAQINAQEETSKSGESPKTRSGLELFALFAHTGSLPWWADHARPQLLAETQAQLLDESPAAFAQLLRELLRDAGVRQRLVNQFDDAQLGQLCELLVPAYQGVFTRETRLLITALQKTDAARLRQSIWNNSLQVTALGGPQYPTLAAFHRAVLERVAADLGAPVSRGGLAERLMQLQAESEAPLAEAYAELQAVAPRLSDAFQAQLLQALAGTPRRAAKRILLLLQTTNETSLTHLFASALAAPRLAENELTHLLRRYQSRGGPLTEAWTALRRVSGRLTASAQANWLAALTAAGTSPSSEDILQLLGRPASEHGMRAEERARLLNLLRVHPIAAPELADEISVGNAGLVILWPFLMGFFTRMGLLEEKDFKDLAARQRAVGLLQALAAPAANFPEYLLPLNKLLCGLEVTHPFDFGPPLRKRESKECGNLLQAVIVQAPVLNNMSVEGFRGSFLLRAGLLTVRDGHWLLRVERQTYDIVLERFPWSWEWIKLPWMESPLRVEWSQR